MTNISISGLKEKTIEELTAVAEELNVEGISGMRKQDLIYAILNAQAEKSGSIYAEGVTTGWVRLSKITGLQLFAGP